MDMDEAAYDISDEEEEEPSDIVDGEEEDSLSLYR